MTRICPYPSLLLFALASGTAIRAFAAAPAAGNVTPATTAPATTAPTATAAALAPSLAPKTAAPLRVAVDPHAPPMIFKSGEKFSGIEAELARNFGEYLGRPVVFVAAKWNDLIPTLLEDKADIIMSGMSITKLRQVRVSFTQPYLRMGQVALCRRGDLSVYINNPNMQNLRLTIGVLDGSTGDLILGSLFSFSTRKPFSTLPEAVRALLDKKVDLVITDFPLAIWQSAENEATIAVVPAQLTTEEVAWATRKDDDELRAAANAFLDKFASSGKLAQLMNKWLPDMSTPATASPPPGGETAAPSSGNATASATK